MCGHSVDTLKNTYKALLYALSGGMNKLVKKLLVGFL